MKKLQLILTFLLFAIAGSAQVNPSLPKIMVIPFTKEGEDIRTILDNDVNRRIAITKVKEGFDAQGYTTVDFVGKLKAIKDNQVFQSDNQTDLKTKIIEMSGCDIYVVTEADVEKDASGSSVNVILSAYEASTGNSLANKVGPSGKFFSDDFGKLTNKAVNMCIEDFVTMMTTKFNDMAKNGRSVLVDISFGPGASMNMTTEVGPDKLALSDALEEWFSKNSYNNIYHIQGTTNLKILFDDVRIPLKDKNGNNYNANKYALEIYKYLKTINLTPAKEIKGNTIYITIN